MKEMRLLRELRHDNINSFIGACIEPTRILLITDYCAKGSLYDIIENEDIRLDDLFIASLIHDLIKGMIYIHDSSLIYHGNLKSSNCVVTSRWMLQVTDFGLHELRNCAENESIGEHQHYRNQFWKAPELLRNSHIFGSQKADVYAFAIIMYEIVSRKGPFGQTAYEPKEIVDLVKKLPVAGGEPFRPELQSLQEAELCPDYVLNCIKDCWNEEPDLRPDFALIRNRLKKMRGGKTKNIMDQMMEMMEKYANNLEDIVTDRTRLLCEEKRKTEDLLHRMLPQSVAEKLTRGQGVEPVSYDSVTIYFSDIVGFTSMSAESTPLQVVNFLNDLYTVFDRIIRGYDVYKVETIGDAYMVVSGLPITNNDRHAGEIASMSLELLSAVKQHRIAHRPNETLKLRIGIHTGPVVAGVVGLTMPRYCLFGDTVNTASRMESNGEALKIHISPKCKEALDKLGGYITEERGVVKIKGKGEVTTYWLVGANENAIQKKPVNFGDLPPPLFCRPRRSPKLTCDSRQPSVMGIHQFNLASRRQSTVPCSGQSQNAGGGGGGGYDYESDISLLDSNFHSQHDSICIINKRYKSPSFGGIGGMPGMSGSNITTNFHNNQHSASSNSSRPVSLNMLNQTNTNDMDCDKRKVSCTGTARKGSANEIENFLRRAQQKPLAMVRPHRIQLLAAAQGNRVSDSTQDIYFDMNDNSNNAVNYVINRRLQSMLLRETQSLDAMPLCKKSELNSVETQETDINSANLSRNNSKSLDTGVSLIIASESNNTHDAFDKHLLNKNGKRSLVEAQPVLEESEEENADLANDYTKLIMHKKLKNYIVSSNQLPHEYVQLPNYHVNRRRSAVLAQKKIQNFQW